MNLLCFVFMYITQIFFITMDTDPNHMHAALLVKAHFYLTIYLQHKRQSSFYILVVWKYALCCYEFNISYLYLFLCLCALLVVSLHYEDNLWLLLPF